jgi:hypothetical protein
MARFEDGNARHHARAKLRELTDTVQHFPLDFDVLFGQAQSFEPGPQAVNRLFIRL